MPITEMIVSLDIACSMYSPVNKSVINRRAVFKVKPQPYSGHQHCKSNHFCSMRKRGIKIAQNRTTPIAMPGNGKGGSGEGVYENKKESKAKA